MKKYKHKSTGNIAVETHSEKNYKVSQPQNFTVPKWIVENSGDWQEVVELDYEILSFKGNSGAILRRYSNDCYGENSGVFSLKDCLELDLAIISIKRLSDNEVFTVGDLCYPDSAPFNCDKITKFETCKAGYFRIESEGKYYIGLDNLVKTKQPLFVTEDGKSVYNEDTIFIPQVAGVSKALLGTYIGILAEDCSQHPNVKYFSTKQAAQDYIDENKPKYSKLDMLDFANHYKGRIIFEHKQTKDVFKTWKGKNGKKQE